MLSGFVLAHAYGRLLREGLRPLAFMKLRYIRLYPLYAIGLLIALPLGMPSQESGAFALTAASAALFLPSPLGISLYPLDPPAWSLFSELVANAWLGIFGRRLSTFVLVVVMAAAAVSLIIVVWRSGPAIYGNTWSTFWQGIIRVAYSFPAGILVYRIWLKYKPPIVMPAVACGVMLLLCLTLPMHPARLWMTSLVLVIFPILVWLSASARPGANAERACRWLGAVSYAIYILHYPILYWGLSVTEHFGIERDWRTAIPLIGLIVIVADIGHRLDEPFRRWLVRRMRRRPDKA